MLRRLWGLAGVVRSATFDHAAASSTVVAHSSSALTTPTCTSAEGALLCGGGVHCIVPVYTARQLWLFGSRRLHIPSVAAVVVSEDKEKKDVLSFSRPHPYPHPYSSTYIVSIVAPPQVDCCVSTIANAIVSASEDGKEKSDFSFSFLLPLA